MNKSFRNQLIATAFYAFYLTIFGVKATAIALMAIAFFGFIYVVAKIIKQKQLLKR